MVDNNAGQDAVDWSGGRDVHVGGRVFTVVTSSGDDGRVHLRLTGPAVADDGARSMVEVAVAPAEWAVMTRVLVDELRTVGRLYRLPVASYGEVVDIARRANPNAYAPWTPEEDERLRTRWREHGRLTELAREFGRSAGALRSRLELLGEVEAAGRHGAAGDGPERPVDGARR